MCMRDVRNKEEVPVRVLIFFREHKLSQKDTPMHGLI